MGSVICAPSQAMAVGRNFLTTTATHQVNFGGCSAAPAIELWDTFKMILVFLIKQLRISGIMSEIQLRKLIEK